ncbi:MAG TPA: ABC transporter permease, partial [Patescibacteria group bacterium]|nr:ABC transporter permease [Patescibacteria group bacterium]
MKKINEALLPVYTFARVDIKRLFRDKVAIFFVFVFPLIFLIIFGSVFKNDGGVSFRVALINQSKAEFATKFAEETNNNKVFDIDEKITSLDQAKEKMNRGQLDATIILPSAFGEVANDKYPSGTAEIIYDQSNQQAGQALGSIMEGVFKDINQSFAPAETPFTVKTESTATKGLTQFDYVFSGILGFTLLSLGIFGPTTVFPRLKQRGVLRRYHTTPIKVWQYFTGNVISNAAVGLIAVAVMFISAVVFFDLNMRGSYLNLMAVVLLGTILMFGIGLSLGGWAKNENQAAPLAQLVALPMMFLSGVFFPTFLMPDLLQSITTFIPLTPIVESVRLVITENKALFDLGPQMAIMVSWTI